MEWATIASGQAYPRRGAILLCHHVRGSYALGRLQGHAVLVFTPLS
jgi:hypothetical protein